MVQQLQHKVIQIQSQSLHIQHTDQQLQQANQQIQQKDESTYFMQYARNVRTAKLVLNGFENWHSTLSTSDTTGSTEADPGGGRENAALNPHPARVTRRWASAS
ncbi:hypothetical protein E4U13_006564, partial [Claviceps humidiphila]